MRIGKYVSACMLLCLVILFNASCAPRGPSLSDRLPESPMPPEPSVSSPSSAAEKIEPEKIIAPSFEQVTAGIDLAVPGELFVLNPSKDTETSAENYYITGYSDPSVPLLMNGIEVENRGEFGSFGYWAELAEGDNAFEFTQNEASQVVTITRKDEQAVATSRITRAFPEADEVIRAGEAYILRCVAPSGAAVNALVQGDIIPLEQNAAAAEGIPATFTAEYTPTQTAGVVNIGVVTYALSRQGKESQYSSQGNLFVMGASSQLLVRAKDVSATVFTEQDTESDYYSVLKRGAVDFVTEIGSNMYRLAMGGWVVKTSLEPLTEAVETKNDVGGAEYTVNDKTETLWLKGISAVPYRAQTRDDQIIFTFYRTSGVGDINLKDSKLFESAHALTGDGDCAITFTLSGENPLWGYLVEYKESGILLTFKAAPKQADGAKPLLGVTVMLDPGHGGNDIGTPGIVGESAGDSENRIGALVEKDIVLSTANAVRVYLEGLGAAVKMTRETDETVDMNDRLEQIQRPDVDFVISLHCNSVMTGRDGTGPSGVEVYYFEDSAAHLADSVLRDICERTGRLTRGAKQGNYKITLNSNAPSVLIELGFMTNPREYDSLCDKQSIYDTAAAIANGIMSAL